MQHIGQSGIYYGRGSADAWRGILFSLKPAKGWCPARLRLGHEVICGGGWWEAGRERGKDREKVESYYRQALPELAAFYISPCILCTHLWSNIRGASAGATREFTAQPGNVNKQAGAGRGEGGVGCSPAQVLKFTRLLFCIVDFFSLRLIALIYFMRALMLNISWC